MVCSSVAYAGGIDDFYLTNVHMKKSSLSVEEQKKFKGKYDELLRMVRLERREERRHSHFVKKYYQIIPNQSDNTTIYKSQYQPVIMNSAK